MAKLDRLDYFPVPGYLLCKPLETTKIGDIEISDDKQMPQLAKVISVGLPIQSDYTDRIIEATCRVGDIIIHSSGGFENIRIDGEEYRIIPFNKVLLIKNRK